MQITRFACVFFSPQPPCCIALYIQTSGFHTISIGQPKSLEYCPGGCSASDPVIHYQPSEHLFPELASVLSFVMLMPFTAQILNLVMQIFVAVITKSTSWLSPILTSKEHICIYLPVQVSLRDLSCVSSHYDLNI